MSDTSRNKLDLLLVHHGKFAMVFFRPKVHFCTFIFSRVWWLCQTRWQCCFVWSGVCGCVCARVKQESDTNILFSLLSLSLSLSNLIFPRIHLRLSGGGRKRKLSCLLQCRKLGRILLPPSPAVAWCTRVVQLHNVVSSTSTDYRMSQKHWYFS